MIKGWDKAAQPNSQFIGSRLPVIISPILKCMPCKWFGGLAEWSIAAVLKTVELKGSVGSNPTASAKVSSFFGKNGVELKW